VLFTSAATPTSVCSARGRGRARAIGARDFRRDALSILERRERLSDGVAFRDTGGDEVRTVHRRMLRQLVDDVGFTRGVDRQRPHARAHARLPIRHGECGPHGSARR